MKRRRQRHDPEVKAKVALEAIREVKTVPELAAQYGLHPAVIFRWKRQLLERAHAAFLDSAKVGDPGPGRDELLKKIGELVVERDFLARGLQRLG